MPREGLRSQLDLQNYQFPDTDNLRNLRRNMANVAGNQQVPPVNQNQNQNPAPDFDFGFDLQVEPADCRRRSPCFFLDFGDCQCREIDNSGGRAEI